jgi:hypothetical protein
MFFLMLLFPSGRLPGPRWRIVVRIWLVAAAAETLAYLIVPGLLEPPYKEIESPLAVDSLSWINPWPPAAVILLSTAAAAVDVVLRFRRARGVESQQFRWLAFTGIIAVISFILSLPVWGETMVVIAEQLMGIAFLGFPVSVGIAILRYRLFNIDRLLNRTLVYALLTAGLAAVYFGLVVGLQEVLQPLSGGSDLAIALTTLVVAALFLPARGRVQTLVDRRFNRRAYDAARTVESFGSRLRQQVDLDTLRFELLAVVDETMQPSRASLWLRGQERGG